MNKEEQLKKVIHNEELKRAIMQDLYSVSDTLNLREISNSVKKKLIEERFFNSSEKTINPKGTLFNLTDDQIKNNAKEYAETKVDKKIASLSEGMKYDSGKPRLDLIPPEVITALGTILDYGSKKYESRNWEKGFNWGRSFAALQRHMWAWWGREDKDPETNESHLWHALCNIAFLVTFEQRKIGKDDRP